MTRPWEYAVSMTKLAQAHWSALRAKIDRYRGDADAPVPEIVEVLPDPAVAVSVIRAQRGPGGGSTTRITLSCGARIGEISIETTSGVCEIYVGPTRSCW